MVYNTPNSKGETMLSAEQLSQLTPEERLDIATKGEYDSTNESLSHTSSVQGEKLPTASENETLLKDKTVNAQELIGESDTPDNSLGLTSTLQAIERKEQKVLSYTDQGTQASPTQSQTKQSDDDDDKDINTNKNSLFTRILNTLIGYKVTSTALKEYNSWLKGNTNESNTWLATWLRMISEKVDNML